MHKYGQQNSGTDVEDPRREDLVLTLQLADSPVGCGAGVDLARDWTARCWRSRQRIIARQWSTHTSSDNLVRAARTLYDELAPGLLRRCDELRITEARASFMIGSSTPPLSRMRIWGHSN